jgi:siroheme synthase
MRRKVMIYAATTLSAIAATVVVGVSAASASPATTHIPTTPTKAGGPAEVCIALAPTSAPTSVK